VQRKQSVNFIWRFSDRNILSVVATTSRKMKSRKRSAPSGEQAKRIRVDEQRNDLVLCCVANSRNAYGELSGACLRQLQLAHVGA
jgi:hypothetical protein